MRIKKPAVAGTVESSDIQITLYPCDEDQLEIHLTSIVEVPYGQAIRRVMEEVLEEAGISSAVVKAVDRGALDCTIRARMMTALSRALEEDTLFKGVRP